MGSAQWLSLFEAIQSLQCQVTCIQKIGVAHGARGRNLGNAMLDSMISRGDPIFLEADAFETQTDGFDLRAWYETKGFRKVGGDDKLPLMVYPPEVAGHLNALQAEQKPEAVFCRL